MCVSDVLLLQKGAGKQGVGWDRQKIPIESSHIIDAFVICRYLWSCLFYPPCAIHGMMSIRREMPPDTHESRVSGRAVGIKRPP